MANVLTVEAKLNGNAQSLIAAAKRAADALNSVVKAAERAGSANAKIEATGRAVMGTLGGMARAATGFAGSIASMGSRVVTSLISIATKATIAGTAMATAFGAGAVKAGLDRLMSIQDSTVALTRMLGSAEAAANLTQKALDVVRGTPFAFPQFAEATRTLTAFGVKAEKVPGILQAIADSAAASGEGAEAVDRITQAFANMAVTGKINSDIIQSLGSAGVNALGILANHFGVTTGEAQEMVSEGLIPAEEAMDILVRGIEEGSHGIAGDFNSLAGAAQDLGKTISGSLGNVKAAFARMGASWLKPFEKDFPRVLNEGVIPLLDKLGEKGAEFAQKFADTGVLDKFTDWLIRVADEVDPFIAKIIDLGKYLSPLMIVFDAFKRVLPQIEAPLREAGQTIATSLVPALADLLVALAPIFPELAKLAPIFARALVELMPTITSGVETLANVLGTFVKVLDGLPDEVLAFGLALLAVNQMGVPVLDLVKSLGNTFWTTSQAIGSAAGATTPLISGLKGIGVAAVAVAAVTLIDQFRGWKEEMLGLTKTTEQFSDMLSSISKFKTEFDMETLFGGGELNSLIRGMGAVSKANVDQLTGDWSGLANVIADVQKSWVGSLQEISSFGIADTSLGRTKENAEALDAALVQLANSGAAGAMQAASSFEEIRTQAQAAGIPVTQLRDLLPNYSQLASESGRNSHAAAEAIARIGQESEFSTSLLNNFSNTLRGAGNAQLTLNDAQIRTQQALANFNSTLETSGPTLDITTEKGRALKGSLDEIAQAYLTEAAATAENTGKQQDAIPVVEAGRQAVINAAEAAGMGKDAAEAYADSLGLIPSDVQTQINANWQEAIDNANIVAQRIRDIPGYKEVVIEQVWRETGAPMGQIKAAYNENGSITTPAGKAFANGGFNKFGQAVSRVPQMVRGGENILWGEPDTGWEAYISGKRSMLQRNKRVWTEAGDRLGMWDDMAQAGFGGGGGGAPAIINVNGVDYPDMDSLADAIMARMRLRR